MANRFAPGRTASASTADLQSPRVSDQDHLSPVHARSHPSQPALVPLSAAAGAGAISGARTAQLEGWGAQGYLLSREKIVLGGIVGASSSRAYALMSGISWRMGEVFEGKLMPTNQTVAVKRIIAGQQTKEHEEQFLHEIQLQRYPSYRDN